MPAPLCPLPRDLALELHVLYQYSRATLNPLSELEESVVVTVTRPPWFQSKNAVT